MSALTPEQKAKLVRVVLCCNDERGNCLGRTEAVNFATYLGPVGTWLELRGPRVTALHRARGIDAKGRTRYELRLAGLRVRCGDLGQWPGSWCLDETLVHVEAARRLARHLLARGWAIEGASDTPPPERANPFRELPQVARFME